MRRPTSSSSSRKAGFTLLEMVIVIAIMALAAAMVLPNINRMLRGNETRAAEFLFKTHLGEAKAQAFRAQHARELVSTLPAEIDPEADPAPYAVLLEEGWSFSLSEPLVITSSGTCNPVGLDLYRGDQLAARRAIDSDCRVVDAP